MTFFSQRTIKASLIALGGLVALSAAATAQKFPERTITMVVPFAAGGSTDVTSRRLATAMQSLLGVPVVVENKVGASGTLGGAFAARSKPDGYTIFVGADQVIATGAMDNLTYDGMKDLAPISMMTLTHMSIVTGPGMPAKDFKEFVAVLKASPGKYGYGTPGERSSPNLAGELFKQAAGVDMLHVPYKGSAPAMTDLIGGHLPIAMATVNAALDQVKSGNAHILATLTDKRLAVTPDVPTVAENGIPLTFFLFTALYVPAGTPKEIRDVVHGAASTVIKSDEFRKAAMALGADPADDTSPEYAHRIAMQQNEAFVKIFRQVGGVKK